MSKLWKKVLAASAAGALVLGLTACGGSGDGGSGDGLLVFMIWDSGQKSGMEAIADAYMEEHPDDLPYTLLQSLPYRSSVRNPRS